MSGRIPCSVPHCRRSKKDDGDGVHLLIGVFAPFRDWLCEKHWALVDCNTRRLHLAAKKRMRVRKTTIAARVQARLWECCKRQAIERAGGIA